ncbi:MAG TPA: antitoxin family protein [Herpetosiphonaceae bacterium]|nr:antitoxin family protein [Herpetosiphonaceae bacterium]
MTTSHTQSFPAIYEDGVLRPLQPLALPEHARVQITIAVTDEAATPDQEQIRAALAAAGLSLVEPPAHGVQALSPEARNALAHQVPPGRPLSQIIDEEREGR